MNISLNYPVALEDVEIDEVLQKFLNKKDLRKSSNLQVDADAGTDTQDSEVEVNTVEEQKNEEENLSESGSIAYLNDSFSNILSDQDDDNLE